MHSLPSFFRVLIATLVLAVAAPALAQDAMAPAAAPEAEWQGVITSQIEAFRHKDAPAAFSFAASSFQQSFPSAEMFFAAIIGSGYDPIMTSTSHSYGKFQLDATGADVMQLVHFIGPHQELFDGVYNLTHEEAGWRVQGVVLTGPSGIGV